MRTLRGPRYTDSATRSIAFVAALWLIGCNAPELPDQIVYPGGWPIEALTVPPDGVPAASYQLNGGRHSGKMPGPFEDSYAIGFRHDGPWAEMVKHVETCLSGMEYEIIDNTENRSFICAFQDSNTCVCLQYTRGKANVYSLSIIQESWINVDEMIEMTKQN